MDAVWAEEVLRDEWDALSAESVKKLTLLVTGDEMQAQKAWAAKLDADMRAGRPT